MQRFMQIVWLDNCLKAFTGNYLSITPVYPDN